MKRKNALTDREWGLLSLVVVFSMLLSLIASPLTSFPISLGAGVAQAAPLSNPHHPTGTQEADCDGYEISGSYVGGSGYRWLEWDVALTVDGSTENIVGSWNGTSPGFEIFNRSGSGPHDVIASGWIKMYGDVFVSESTIVRTFDNSPNNQTSGGISVAYSNNDNTVSVTPPAGYSITKVELDVDNDGFGGFHTYFTGSSSGVTLNPNPGGEIEETRVTVYRPAGHSKGSLMNTYTYYLNFDAQCSREISAKALCDHEIDWTEWHFVITSVDPPDAPASIHVEWSNGNSEDIPLDGVTGHVAHYTTTSNLDADVTSATAVIDASWSGQFNLSHGPACGPDHQYSYEVEQWNHCDRWERSARLLDFGQPVEPWVVVDGATWPWASNPYLGAGPVPEQTYFGVDLGQGQVFDITFPAMAEPEECQLVHQVAWDYSTDCEGVSAWYQVDGGTPVEFFSHDWTLPFVLETVDIPEFPIPTNPGELYSQELVGGLKDVQEPEDCYELCSATSAPVYGEWSEWSYDEATGQMMRSRTVTWYDKYNEEHVCKTEVEKEYKELEGFTVAFVIDPCIYRDGQSWAKLHVSITGKGTVYLYDATNALVATFQENGSKTLPAGKYTWKLVPTEGYEVIGPDHGELDLVTCDPDKPVYPPTNGQGFTMDVVGAVVTTTIEAGKETGEPGGLERMLERFGQHLLQPFLERIGVWSSALAQKAWWDPKAESFFLRTLTLRPIGDRTYQITVDTTGQGPALSDGYPYLWMGLPHDGKTGALFYGRKVRMGPPVCLEPGTHIPMHGGFGATAWIGATPVIGTPEEMAEVDQNNLTFCQDLGQMLYRDAVHAGLITADSWWIYGDNSLENALGEAGATSLYAYYLGENPDLTQVWETGMVYSPAAVEPWNGREGGLPIWGWSPTEGFNANPDKVRAMFQFILPPADFLGGGAHQLWADQYAAAGFDRTWTLTQRISFYLKTYGDLR